MLERIVSSLVPSFGAGSGPIHLLSVHCWGFEDRLLDCPHSVAKRGSSCQHSQDLGLECSESPLLVVLRPPSNCRVCPHLIVVCPPSNWRVCPPQLVPNLIVTHLVAVKPSSYCIGSYRGLPSQHPSPCKSPPPFLMIIWFACIYIYVPMASPCKHPPPFFFPANFKHPWVLTR